MGDELHGFCPEAHLLFFELYNESVKDPFKTIGFCLNE